MAFRTEIEDFARLYERSYPSVYRTILGICGDEALAADLTQDAYLQAYRQRTSFRGDAPVEAWLHRIAVNAALGGLRRRRVRWAEPLDPVRHDRATRPVDAADTVDIAAALAQLEPRNRAAVVLRYYHDFDYATIATILGTSVGNVGSMLTRSIDRLRRDLDPAGPITSTTPVVPATIEEIGHGR